MNATPEQFLTPGTAPRKGLRGLLHTVKSSIVRRALAGVDLSPMHMGTVQFGEHSIQIGDVVKYVTDAAPAAAGEVGMNSGRLQVYVGGQAQDVPHAAEVLPTSGGTLAGNMAAGSNKITGLQDGSSGSQDACSVAQMENYVGRLIAPSTAAGSPGEGLIGKGTVTTIDGLTPATGNIVIATDSGTPAAGASDALTAGDVAEYDGTSWKKIVSASGGFVPNNTYLLVSTTTAFIASSGLTISTDEGKIAVFTGSSNNPASFKTPSDGTLAAIKGEGALYENKVLAFDGSVPTGVWRTTAAAGTTHSGLTGLTSGDDHTQYAYLAGRAGGQTLKGGSASGEHLLLESTSNGTKGDVRIVSGTDLRMAGDNELTPVTSGQGSLGTSGAKWKEVYTLVLNTGDLKLKKPNGADDEAWHLIEESNGLRAINMGTGVEHKAHFVRKGSIADRLLTLLG